MSMTDREFIADWKGFTNSSEMYDAQEMGRLFAEVVDRLDALVKSNEDRDLTSEEADAKANEIGHGTGFVSFFKRDQRFVYFVMQKV